MPSQGFDLKRGPKAFIERRERATRTAILCPDIKQAADKTASVEARHAEFVSLAAAIHLELVIDRVVPVREVRPSTFIGGGQVEELAAEIERDEVELVVIDAALTPIQQRNLERGLGTKVLDRTALILEIFGERAATREGVLQVELAHLNYQRSRLVRSWTHLERQRGGYGFMGGPGETQIEADRRQLQQRISLLEKRIEKVRQTRAQQRKPRAAVPYPVAALVGYTNAGKSSLFNRLTGAGVPARDQLFATLDTSVRGIVLPHGKEAVLSDTVGFIAHLPTDLVAAFRATLEEVVMADVILHVRDVANPDHEAQGAEVMQVLDELGVSPEATPIVEVWTKIDLAPEAADRTRLLKGARGGVPVSAQTGQGIDALLTRIEEALAEGSRTYEVSVDHENGRDTAWLHENTEVLSRTEEEHASRFKVRVAPRFRATFLEMFAGRIQSTRKSAA